jgi:hypothetical protein
MDCREAGRRQHLAAGVHVPERVAHDMRAAVTNLPSALIRDQTARSQTLPADDRQIVT